MPEEIFIKRKAKAQPGFNIGVVLNRKSTKGDVGIEIECEGRRLPKGESTPPPWVYHVDHSLRGADNGEYVLAAPIAFDAVPEALNKLWSVFREMKTVIDDSNRTSVHVHLNCQSFHMNRLTSFLALYFCMEEVLTEWCGEHRVGNLFCLRAKDAPAIVSQIKKFIKTDGGFELKEHLHYAGLNANALYKFGSLEIRMLRGCSEPDTIMDWVAILQRIYELSASFDDPRDICSQFSYDGPISFFENILGDKVNIVRGVINWDNERITSAMFDGMRMAQDLCYCRDWNAYKALAIKPDPFRRDTKKMAKRLLNEGGLGVDIAAALNSINDEPEPIYDAPQHYADAAQLQQVYQSMSQLAAQQVNMNGTQWQQAPPMQPSPYVMPDWAQGTPEPDGDF